MNNDRRKEISELKEKIEALKKTVDEAMTVASDLSQEAASIKYDEEEYHDNIPESMEEKRATAHEKVENLAYAEDTLGEIEGSLLEMESQFSEILSNLDSAAE